MERGRGMRRRERKGQTRSRKKQSEEKWNKNADKLRIKGGCWSERLFVDPLFAFTLEPDYC